MKQFLLALLLFGQVFATNLSANPVKRLVKEYFPKHSKNFVFEIKEQDPSIEKDFFEISNYKKGKIKIVGNNYVSIASGLNWYLSYYCNCNFSFCEDQLNMPKSLPAVEKTIYIETPLTKNSYMNYCTFGYTTAYWDWERWEREIDYMALQGINLPLAMVGTEVVWRNTLRQFGYTDDQIKAFLCGPVYFPFILMGNTEKIGGPLPDEWFDLQEELQKKIVKRMREWGMDPVFHSFYGNVPTTLKEKYPEAKIIDQGKWVGIPRPPVLISTDPLFKEMADVWYLEYEKLYGTTKYYAGDLFHEGGNTRGLDVTEIARGVYSAMSKNVPNSVWVIQSWQVNPRKELLDGLSKENVLIIDLATEYWQNWKKFGDGFWGYPFLCAHVTNYGANVGLHGRLDDIAKSSIVPRKDSIGRKSVKGVAAVPEGIEVNPIAFQLANEMRWRGEVPEMEEWVRLYSNRRYGVKDKDIEAAWSIFYQTAYGSYDGHRRQSESVFCAKPTLNREKIRASPWGQVRTFYDVGKFAEGVGLLLKNADQLKDVASYEYDVVDFVRQYIGDLGRATYYSLVDAFNAGDKVEFERCSKRFLELLLDQDRLLSSYAPFFVGTWIDGARSKSSSKEIQDYYEWNARMIITTWTKDKTPLYDYASKEWGGLLKDVYYVRWSKYIEVLRQRLDGKTVENPEYYTDDSKWVELTNSYVLEIDVAPIDLAIQLHNKYNK